MGMTHLAAPPSNRLFCNECLLGGLGHSKQEPWLFFSGDAANPSSQPKLWKEMFIQSIKLCSLLVLMDCMSGVCSSHLFLVVLGK